MKCRYCPRRLKTRESRARGYGYICGRKNGLIPPPVPRHARPTTPKPAKVTKPPKATAAPDVHPDQTAIPIDPEE
ncbi:DUF6011 domain-containing protein [Streptomyces griseoincarnatus]